MARQDRTALATLVLVIAGYVVATAGAHLWRTFGRTNVVTNATPVADRPSVGPVGSRASVASAGASIPTTRAAWPVRRKPATRPASAARSTDANEVAALEQAAYYEATQESVARATAAREALQAVGTNAEVNQVWAAAIDDASLPENVRSDLIEDLNEDGFPDPHNATAGDLPLIVSRLKLIESLAPDALDQSNADAFAEAHKDLLNMYVRANADQEQQQAQQSQQQAQQTSPEGN